jgi:dTDP-4-amino-4,6-dideoxygalactose transaminase
MNYGDVSTVSFHATKLFHTGEGGGIATNDDDIAHRVSYMRNFGHNGQEDFWGLGINGKGSELHAAMGLSVFPYIDQIMASRKQISELYDKLLEPVKDRIHRPVLRKGVDYNFAYYPIVFDSEQTLINVRAKLNAQQIYPRRYFYPSLSQLPYIQAKPMPVADSISKRVLCLPLYFDFESKDLTEVVGIISDTLKLSS